MENYNDKQYEAISSKANVTIVIAGAGSGKTTVLIERINKLIENGVNPKNILAITFTNKAAKEMKERLIAKVGPHAYMATVMTFHALAVKIIKENLRHLKYYDQNMIIIDDEDKKKILKQILKDMNKQDQFKVPEVLYNISYAKSFSLTYKNVMSYVDVDKKEIYQKYQEYCQQNNAMDFDDLLLTCYDLLKIKEVREKYNNLFKFLHVDEFQDTSALQGEILKKLKTIDNNLFIVGDVEQSIYTWRGATIENILTIHEDYQDVKIVKLEQNYRSTQKILDSANKLIEHNKKRIDKNLWTENKKGMDISYYNVNTNIDEANTIVREINSIVDYGGSYSDFAVLYRYNYQSRKIEEKFIQNKIPYKIFGGIKFYQRMEIKDILAYLRIFINPHDNISLLRIINVPKRKVGEKSEQKLLTYAQENKLSLYESIKEVGSKTLQEFIKLIEEFKDIIYLSDKIEFDSEFEMFIEKLKYEEYLLTQDDKFKVADRMLNIKELKEGLIGEIELENNLVDYINEIAVFENNEETVKEEVILSTIHGVKGLEFENVFLTGMINGKFPKEQALYDEDEMEEERRLAYVGITRAKRSLTLLSYNYDFKYEEQQPSIFLQEMGINTDKKSLDDFIF
ncbi:MAG: ATP-dependent helicase [Mycoplasmatales bacterium]